MKKILSVLLIFVMCPSIFTACDSTNSGSGFQPPEPPDQSQNGGGNGGSSEIDGGSTGEKADSDKTDIPDDLPDSADTLTITLSEGTSDCWTIDGDTLTFSGLDADTVCSVTGEFNGQIVIDAGDDYKFELELNGVKLYSGEHNPITVLSGDKVILTAKKGTQNYIYDTRAAISDDDETSYSAAIYSTCDLDLGGKGELVVVSANNNGIHTKDDLKVKNLTLYVTCEDNTLKGNDSVTVAGGTLTLIAKTGDGITFNDGNVYVYAGGDGLDSNSKTSYRGIVFAGGNIAVINTSGGDSSIDTENGYTYTGGSVLAICPANGMTNEVTNCRNFSSVATKTTLNLSKGQTLSATVDGSVTVSFEMPCGLSAFVVYLGSSSAKISAN